MVKKHLAGIQHGRDSKCLDDEIESKRKEKEEYRRKEAVLKKKEVELNKAKLQKLINEASSPIKTAIHSPQKTWDEVSKRIDFEDAASLPSPSPSPTIMGRMSLGEKRIVEANRKNQELMDHNTILKSRLTETGKNLQKE